MIITTPQGDLRANEHDGYIEALGIPFAAAPRLRPPEAIARWDGVREATAFGPASLQPPGDTFMTVDLEQGEDCLSINVWTPACDDRARPVMLWIHGGGYRSGGGSHLLSLGNNLARRGDVVVVTFNYRLGALGFLAHPDLATDGGVCGNWGVLDQLAALRWVHDNIAAFGGDPNNVTLFGESAGGGSVGLVMSAPASERLYHRAAMQSGVPAPPSLRRAAELAEATAAEVGAASVTGLRNVPGERILEAQVAIEGRGSEAMSFTPCIDGTVIPNRPLSAFEGGVAAGVPTIIGTNADEIRLMGAGREPEGLSEEHLRRRLARRVGDGAQEVIDVYAKALAERGEAASADDIWLAAETDRFFRVPSLRFADARAEHAPTYVYLFTHRSPAYGGRLGACHVLEIPFVFGHQGRPDIAWFTGEGAAEDRLSASMMASWVAFARTGNPSTTEVAWPVYDAADRPTLIWDVNPRVEHAPREDERAVVDKWLK